MPKSKPVVPDSCPECGHRAVAHCAGQEPCAMPRCPCPVAKAA